MKKKLPIAVFLHGGGFCIRNNPSKFSSFLCVRHNIIVVAFRYRLSPEFKFPIPFEDSYSCIEWVIENSENLGGCRNDIHLVGSSAGGNLVMSIIIKLNEEKINSIKSISAIYPAISHDFESQSFKNFGKGHFLTTDIIKWFNQSYATMDDANNVYLRPSLSKNLNFFPKCLIVLAEKDPLFDEGFEFHNKLKTESKM